MSVRVSAFGDRGFLVEPGDGVTSGPEWVLAAAARCRLLWPDAEVVPGLASVLVTRAVAAGRHGSDAHALGVALSEVGTPGAGVDAAVPGPTEHVVPVAYDGADLEGLAGALRIGGDELVARHLAAPWTVAAVGFAPGFGYLTCADPIFGEVPRRADPRPRVPPGSVALAAGMCAIYPSATPVGWQLIGRTEVVMFDPGASPPARLRTGDVVRFVRQA